MKIKEDEQASSSIQEKDEEDEREDQDYQEWTKWKERDRKRVENETNRQMEAENQTKSWAMYRECTRLLEETRTRWIERQEDEKIRKLERPKAGRWEKEKRQVARKVFKKKEGNKT